MKKLGEKEVRNLKIRADKHELKSSHAISIIDDLYYSHLEILKENASLRESLNSIIQQLPPEGQLQNVLAAQLETAISCQEKSSNFLEINNSINNQAYLITIQKKFGNTPAQLLKKSEIRRLKASQKIVNLKRTIYELKRVISSQKKELAVRHLLIAPYMGSLEDLNITKEAIVEAYKTLKTFAQRYNMRVQSYRLKDVPKSAMHSLHEAWAFASKEGNRALHLEKEVTKLKIKLARLKRECVLYNKKRRTY